MSEYPIPTFSAPRPFVPMTGQAHQSYIMPAGVIELSIPISAKEIVLQAITQNIRMTLDGTDPTTGRGFQIVAGDPERRIMLSNQTRLKFIREANGAVLQYQYGE